MRTGQWMRWPNWVRVRGDRTSYRLPPTACRLLFSLLPAACCLLVGCGGTTREAFPTPQPNLAAATIAVSTPGPVPNAVVKFPEDEAPHPALTEWWYYTGHVTTTDGQRYGVEYVIFQGSRVDFPIGYAAHFAIVDPQKPGFTFDQDAVSVQNVPFGGNDGFDLRVNDWTMQGKAGTDHLRARMKNGAYAIDVTTTDLKGPVLEGGGQFSYGPGGTSYYYSRTRLSASGTITVGADVKQIAGGTLWFDHQWGNFLATAGGWDWFSTQLDDQSEMMIYHLRDAQGNILQTFGEYVPAVRSRQLAGDGTESPVRAIELLPEQFTIAPLGTWTSPTTGITYPSGWRVSVAARGDVPAMDLTYTPVVPNAELDTRGTTSVIYWEGDTTITGTKGGQVITGSGYVELTGYDIGK